MTNWADDRDEGEQEERERNRLREQMLQLSAGELTGLANALRRFPELKSIAEQYCRDSILPEAILLLRRKGWLVMDPEAVQ